VEDSASPSNPASSSNPAIQPTDDGSDAFRASEPAKAWRIAEVLSCGLALILLLPLLLILGIAIWLTDGFPILFRQVRVGRNGEPFELLKLRSMRKDNAGMQVTSAGDPRITHIGRILRRYKLDEVPQLWNVVRGDMALVGPRPEVPRYVDLQDPIWRSILRRRPGITDVPTLVYRNEEEILASSSQPERFYRDVILPDKLALNLAYGRHASAWQDLRLVMLSVRYSLWPAGFNPETIRSAFMKH
jgi:lipopolysaccharide/colanic/teichoic acid biosynthesis glycosyltransferase